MEVDVAESARETVPQRVINPEGTTNFRDLGGYVGTGGRRLAWRTLFRSDSLDRLTEAGVSTFLGLGIRTVVDLRETGFVELLSDVEAVSSNTGMVHLPWDLSGDPGNGDVHQMYRNFLHDNIDLFRAFFSLLADTRHLPLVFHCASGKDRTGILAAIVLRWLGVDDGTLYADYCLTGELNPEWWLEEGWIKAVVEEIEGCGGIEAFLTERSRIAPSTLAAVRRNLLEETGV
jgi:protein-tyrosine phosphatase